MSRIKLNRLGSLIVAPALLAVAGCVGSQPANKAAVEIRGSDPAAAQPAPSQPATDGNGIINYDSYQAAVARPGDTVATVAARIGLSASELGGYNGLSPNHALLAGDELVLPPRPGGYGGPPIAQPAPQPASPAFGYAGNAPASGGSAIEAVPLDGSASVPAAPGATSSGAWSPDLAAAAIDRANTFNAQGNLAVPPSAAEPLPPAPQAPGALASPRLDQYQTPMTLPQSQPQPRPVETITTPEAQIAEPDDSVAQPTVSQVAAAATAREPAPVPELRLLRPVKGLVVVGFQQGAGRARNDGIDFAAPAGSPVIAAADGEVALVSQSIGGLGNIVLIRHPGEYLTVYGRVDRVSVAKGNVVRRGQKIGVVSPSTEPRMHFEVRQGAESLDPERFF